MEYGKELSLYEILQSLVQHCHLQTGRYTCLQLNLPRATIEKMSESFKPKEKTTPEVKDKLLMRTVYFSEGQVELKPED